MITGHSQNMLVVYSFHYFFFGMFIGIVFSGQPPFNDRPPLLAATEYGISLYDEGTWEEHVLYRENDYFFDYILSLDMHYDKGLVFWREAVHEPTRRYYTKRAKFSQKSLSSITTLSTQDTSIGDLVVDWIHDKYYWFDIGEHTHSIKVANLDGSDAKQVLQLVKPKKAHGFLKVEIDPLNRWIYFFAFPDEDVNLERVDMDGQNREVVESDICDKLPLCDTLFEVDHTSGRVYWTNYFSSKIYSVGADGQDRRSHDFDNYATTSTSNQLGHTFSYRTLDMYTRFAYKDNIYYTPYIAKDYNTRENIYRLTTRNTTVTTLPTVGAYFQQVKLFHPSAQPTVAAVVG